MTVDEKIQQYVQKLPRFLGIVLDFGCFPFSSLVLPQPPVTRAVRQLQRSTPDGRKNAKDGPRLSDYEPRATNSGQHASASNGRRSRDYRADSVGVPPRQWPRKQAGCRVEMV